MSARLRFTTAPFDWRRLVFSHGWVHLAPFAWSEAGQTLARKIRLSSGEITTVAIDCRRRDGRNVIRATLNGSELSSADRRSVRRQLTRSLRLGEDFSRFHALCEADSVLRFVGAARCGGLLRGTSAFEDVLKTACTTNCDWRNT